MANPFSIEGFQQDEVDKVKDKYGNTWLHENIAVIPSGTKDLGTNPNGEYECRGYEKVRMTHVDTQNTEERTVDITSQSGTITPNRYPMSKVAYTVKPSVSSNIREEYIKEGINILGVVGTYKPEGTNLSVADIATATIMQPSGRLFLAQYTPNNEIYAKYLEYTVSPGVDEDIKPENIRNGVNILGVAGTYTGGRNVMPEAFVKFTNITSTGFTMRIYVIHNDINYVNNAVSGYTRVGREYSRSTSTTGWVEIGTDSVRWDTTNNCAYCTNNVTYGSNYNADNRYGILIWKDVRTDAIMRVCMADTISAYTADVWYKTRKDGITYTVSDVISGEPDFAGQPFRNEESGVINLSTHSHTNGYVSIPVIQKPSAVLMYVQNYDLSVTDDYALLSQSIQKLASGKWHISTNIKYAGNANGAGAFTAWEVTHTDNDAYKDLEATVHSYLVWLDDNEVRFKTTGRYALRSSANYTYRIIY